MSDQEQVHDVQDVQPEAEGKDRKRFVNLHETQNSWRRIMGDSFVVHQEYATGSFQAHCRSTGIVIFAMCTDGTLLEVYRDKADGVKYGSMESAVNYLQDHLWDREKLHKFRSEKLGENDRQKAKKAEVVNFAELAAG